jgi:hypothetical protein
MNFAAVRRIDGRSGFADPGDKPPGEVATDRAHFFARAWS